MLLPRTDIDLDVTGWAQGPWYKREALAAIGRGHFEAIKGRHDKDLYLFRAWLSTPRLQEDARWESDNSLLLHYFARADDDGALHSHPWSFTSEVLSGGYTETVPPDDWLPIHGGPPMNGPGRTRHSGSVRFYRAQDLHAVSFVQGDTWTLLRTEDRERDWGFFPPGQPWVDWQTFLGVKPS